jgi:hypothetical protein
MLNTTINFPNFGGGVNVQPNTGFAVGGSIGYDFVGPRVEVEGVFRSNTGNLNFAPVGSGTPTWDSRTSRSPSWATCSTTSTPAA